MLNRENEADNKAYELLLKTSRKQEGINFTLAMRNPDDSVTIYGRQNQPCQGGEMRTYGAKSTRPYDRRPGDLCHPFPDGIPEAVSVNFFPKYSYTLSPDMMDLIRAFYSDDSPYHLAFGSPNSIELPVGDDGNIWGVVYNDTNVDSTVLVNSLQAMKTIMGQGAVYKMYREQGFSNPEAIMMLMLSTGDPRMSIPPTGTYYFSQKSSLRRIITGKPHDLTGGLYRDRFAYNRPQVQSIFAAGDGEVATNWSQALTTAGLVLTEPYEYEYSGRKYNSTRPRKIEIEEYSKIARQIIDEAMELSKDEDYSIQKFQVNMGTPPGKVVEQVLEIDSTFAPGFSGKYVSAFAFIDGCECDDCNKARAAKAKADEMAAKTEAAPKGLYKTAAEMVSFVQSMKAAPKSPRKPRKAKEAKAA